MRTRQVLLYFAWSRPAEPSAPLAVIDDRFPAVFELRRLFYPNFEQLSDAAKVDQGIAGFLDHIQKPNFQAFAEQAEALTGHKAIQIERIADDGAMTPLDSPLAPKKAEPRTGHKAIQIERIADDGAMTPLDSPLDGVDSIVVISFDSLRTEQAASAAEVEAIRHFLDVPDHLIVVC